MGDRAWKTPGPGERHAKPPNDERSPKYLGRI